jgi:hypothetical protein
MALRQIKFEGPFVRSVDEFHLPSGSPYALNCYLDEVGGLNRRPGLVPWKTVPLAVPASIRWSFWWKKKRILVLVAGVRVYACTSASGVFTDITGDTLAGALRPVFSSNGTWLYIAAGGAMLRWNGTGLTATETDVNAPTLVSQLAEVDGIVIANSYGTQEWFFAEPDPGGATLPLVWNAAGLTAQANSDNLSVVRVAWREVYLGGESSIEIWKNTGSTSVFEQIAVIERGIIAPDSFVFFKTTAFWLDEDKRVVNLVQRDAESVSDAIDTEIASIADVSDAVGTIAIYKGRAWYVISFPAGDRTFALDLSTKTWVEWTYWTPSTRAHGRILTEQFIHIPEWNVTVANSRATQVSPVLYSAGGYADAGADIRWIWRGNHNDWGTVEKKECPELVLALVRGEQTNPAAEDSVLKIRWRDDGKTTWCMPREVSLGKMGDRNAIRRLFNLGEYRTRQYEIQITDQVPVSIRGLSEDVRDPMEVEE